MATTEERAEDYANKVWTNPMFAQEWEECKRDYCQGANDQKAIDIDKFKSKLKSILIIAQDPTMHQERKEMEILAMIQNSLED